MKLGKVYASIEADACQVRPGACDPTLEASEKGDDLDDLQWGSTMRRQPHFDRRYFFCLDVSPHAFLHVSFGDRLVSLGLFIGGSLPLLPMTSFLQTSPITAP